MAVAVLWPALFPPPPTLLLCPPVDERADLRSARSFLILVC